MTISEHLIENALCFFERNKHLKSEILCENFLIDELLNEQAKEIGISMLDLWYVTQYIDCTYRPHIENKVKARYGYDIDEVKE